MKPLLATIAITLAAPVLFAAANLRVTAMVSENPVRAGLPFAPGFLVQNLGPDIAKNAVLTTTASAPIALHDIGVHWSPQVTVTAVAPLTAGPFTVTATVSSDTEDADPSDNIASRTVTVSTNPDLTVFLRAPVQQDLALPFTLSIFVGNASAFDAHDVDVTVNFRPDVDVQSLPTGCSSVAAGRIVCHVAAVAAQRPQIPAMFTPTFYAPHAYGNGSILFTASVTEREPDFDPASNTNSTQSTLYDTFYVSTTANDGSGSLRQAILDANADCPGHEPCLIAFRISEPSETLWKTIRISSPLPAIAASGLRIDGSTQTAFFGDVNPDGPEIEISGRGTVDGDGLLITRCFSEVSNLAIGGFLRNAISVTGAQEGCTSSPAVRELHHLFLGSDPTGSSARPNGRGIATSVTNGGASFYGPALSIHDCVISGNTGNGIFGTSGLLKITNDRIGVKAHADEPLPNGSSGVFIGAGGFGSNVGPEVFVAGRDPSDGGNVIAFNGESGVAVAKDAAEVNIRNNRIWGNRLLGIDIGQDGPTMSSAADSGDPISIPTLTLAHYDPVSNKTIIEGVIPPAEISRFFNFKVNIYASDAFNPSGFGEGQRPLGATTVIVPGSTFHFEADGNLAGQWITATNTRDQVFLSQTSEFSRAIPVQGRSVAPWRRSR
jgi:hypothetical protein